MAVSVQELDCAVRGDALAAPHPAAFPGNPQSWYFVCAARALAPGALRELRVGAQRITVFRTAAGRLGALDARCPHFGASLTSGTVLADSVECPLHRFRFGRDGRCATQPLQTRAYAVEEKYGAIFVFPAARPLFPLPTFDGDPELASAPPRRLHLITQWFIVAANAFDGRHLQFAHDRHAAEPPRVSASHPHALEVRYEYEIRGRGWIDRLVRRFSGPRVELKVTSWGGNFLQVHARFARDESFGLLLLAPAPDDAARLDLTLIASARRRGSGALAALRARGKSLAIAHMLRGDIRGLNRLDYLHGGLLPGDESVARFLRWAAALPAVEPLGEKNT